MTTVRVNLTNITVLVPRLHDCGYHVSTSTTLECRSKLIHGSTIVHSLLTCDISVCSPALPASEAGDFMEFLLLYLRRVCRHISARFPLNGFPINIALEIVMKICW